MLRLLITIVGLVIDRSRLMIDRGMVNWFINRSVMDWCMMHRCMMHFGMVNNGRSSMNWMMNSRGSMMNSMSTKCCKWNCRSSSHKRDKSK